MEQIPHINRTISTKNAAFIKLHTKWLSLHRTSQGNEIAFRAKIIFFSRLFFFFNPSTNHECDNQFVEHNFFSQNLKQKYNNYGRPSEDTQINCFIFVWIRFGVLSSKCVYVSRNRTTNTNRSCSGATVTEIFVQYTYFFALILVCNQHQHNVGIKHSGRADVNMVGLRRSPPRV